MNHVEHFHFSHITEISSYIYLGQALRQGVSVDDRGGCSAELDMLFTNV